MAPTYAPTYAPTNAPTYAGPWWISIIALCVLAFLILIIVVIMRSSPCGVFASSSQSEAPEISSSVNVISSPAGDGGNNNDAYDSQEQSLARDSNDHSLIGSVDAGGYLVPVTAVANSDSQEQSLARNNNSNSQIGAVDAGGYLVPVPANAFDILRASLPPPPPPPQPPQNEYAHVIYADTDTGSNDMIQEPDMYFHCNVEQEEPAYIF